MEITLSVMMDVASRAVGLTFAYAAATKIVDVESFCEGIRGYNLLPDALVSAAAKILIASEVAIAITHLAKLAQPVAIPFALLLLLFFLTVTAVSLKRGVHGTCLCFGANRGDPLGVRTLFRIGLLFGAELALLQYALFNSASPDAPTIQPSNILFSLLVATLVLVLVGWSFATPDIRFLLRRRC